MWNPERLVRLVHAQIDDAPDACGHCRIHRVDSLRRLVADQRRNQE
jgi:CRP-like cAMP-binding protein